MVDLQAIKLDPVKAWVVITQQDPNSAHLYLVIHAAMPGGPISGWYCSCKGFQFSGHCKHAEACAEQPASIPPHMVAAGTPPDFTKDAGVVASAQRLRNPGVTSCGDLWFDGEGGERAMYPRNVVRSMARRARSVNGS